VLPAGHMPNPGNQTCTVCHTAAATNYAVLASNAVLHTGISGNCALCHGSTSATLTFYNNFTVKSAVLSPAHIPISRVLIAAPATAPRPTPSAPSGHDNECCDPCLRAGNLRYLPRNR